MIYTDDPIADAENYADEHEEALEKMPVCESCGEHIQDEYAYYINDEWICEECLKSEYRREVKPEW